MLRKHLEQLERGTELEVSSGQRGAGLVVYWGRLQKTGYADVWLKREDALEDLPAALPLVYAPYQLRFPRKFKEFKG